MAYRNPVYTETLEAGISFSLYLDNAAENPRKAYDTFGTLVTFGSTRRNYNLEDDDAPDTSRFEDAEEFLTWLASNHVGKYPGEIPAEHISRILKKHFVYCEVYFGDRVDFAAGSVTYNQPRAFAQPDGIIYCTTEWACKNWGKTSGYDLVDYHDGKPPKPVWERANDLLLGEVRELNSYLSGEVFGYSVDDAEDGDELDACWGFYGREYALEMAREAAQDALRYKQHEAEVD